MNTNDISALGPSSGDGTLYLYVTLTQAFPIPSNIMSVGTRSGNIILQVGQSHDAPHCSPQ